MNRHAAHVVGIMPPTAGEGLRPHDLDRVTRSVKLLATVFGPRLMS
jgi:hypothetical protein